MFTSATRILLASAFVTSQVLAQSSYYSNQTAPFNLLLLSSNSTFNGSYLAPCHEGAATEALCPSGSNNTLFVPEQFNLNYSSSATIDPSQPGLTGLLTWVLPGGNFNVSSSMAFTYNPSSNVAVPIITPGDNYTPVGFDKEDKLFYPQNGFDDTVTPEKYVDKPLYRWLVCETYVGYSYETLAWVLGDKEPQNPSCVKVDVKRVWV